MPDGLPPDGTQLRSTPSHAVLTLPNMLTFARLCAVPLAVWLVLDGRLALAFALFVGAGVTDAVDGWLARVRNARSQLGAVLDPIADKALLVSMFVVLAAIGILPTWLAILVVFRDLLIVGGVLAMTVLGHPLMIRPLRISKLNTALQLLLVAVALLLAGFGLRAPAAERTLVWAVALTTLVSGCGYVCRAARVA